jgi:cytochrome P450
MNEEQPSSVRRVARQESARMDARPVPVARGYPLLGALPQLLRDPLQALTRIAHDNRGAVVAVPFGPVRTYLVTHPDHIEYVLQKNWRNFPKGDAMWRSIRRLVGNGLVTSDGELWQRQRRLMQPLFAQGRLAELGDKMIATVNQALDELAPRAESGATVDMAKEMALISRQVILSTIFGSRIERAESEHLGEALMAALQQVNLRMFLFFVPERIPLPGEAILRRSILTIDDTLRRVFGRWRASTTSGGDLLSILIEQGRATPEAAMDERQLRDELVTLFVAGHESTGIALGWLLYLLDQHPEVEKRIRAELAEVVGEGPLTLSHVERLSYMKMAILEAMRVYPPVWLFFRTCLEADRIGDYAIPAGANLILSPWITHRDPALWDAPGEYRPERFLPEPAARMHRYAHFPFGGGPRMCIGNTLALMEIQIVVALTMMRWRPRLVPGHRVAPKSATALGIRGGLPMRLSPAPSMRQL